MSIPLKTMLADIADRERLAGNLFAFAWEVVLRNIPNKVLGLHHMLKTQKLEKLLSDNEMQDLYIGEPPRSGKTTYASLAFPAWAIGRNPFMRILIASSTTERAEMLTGNVRDLLADPEYRRVFPDAVLNPASLARGNWTTMAGGSMLGAGVGKAIQGAPADLAIIDDPYASLEDAFSKATRAAVVTWYVGTFRTRLEPGAKVVLVCQRMHSGDLAGTMISNFAENPNGRQLQTLILPAVSEGRAIDPLGREEGELLWPGHHDERYLAPHREDPYVWRTLYMQRPPVDDGDWMAGLQFGKNPQVTTGMGLYMASDVADSIGKGDATVHAVVGHDRKENLFYVMDLWRGHVDVATGAQEFLKMFARWKPSECLFDSDQFSKSLLIHVENMKRQQGLNPHIRVYNIGNKDKGDRASALRGMLVRGLWRLDESKPWTETIKRELRVFPNGTTKGVDDCVDALALIGRHLSRTSTEPPPPPPPKPLPTIQEMTLNGLGDYPIDEYDSRLRLRRPRI